MRNAKNICNTPDDGWPAIIKDMFLRWEWPFVPQDQLPKFSGGLLGADSDPPICWFEFTIPGGKRAYDKHELCNCLADRIWEKVR